MAYLMLDMARTRPTVGVATVAPSPTAIRTIIHTPSPQPTVSMTRTPIQTPLTSLLGTVLIVPTAGVNSPIVEVYVGDTSWDVSDLGNHVGHLQGTSSWDDPIGNIGLAGHVERADGTKGVFANLSAVQVGDPIMVKRGGQQWNYVIRSLNRVDPNDISVLYPGDHNQITLITCNDYDLMNNTYRERLVVVAERVT